MLFVCLSLHSQHPAAGEGLPQGLEDHQEELEHVWTDTHRDIGNAGRRAEDGSGQRALPQPNFELPDLDFLLSIPLEFQVVSQASLNASDCL